MDEADTSPEGVFKDITLEANERVPDSDDFETMRRGKVMPAKKLADDQGHELI